MIASGPVGKACWGLFLVFLSFGHPAAAEDKITYRVAPEESELEIRVFRAGALGRLGHNHIITSRGITGSVVVGRSPTGSSIDLSLPVESLAVDDPAARTNAGSAFESEVSDDDREGTRRNMMGDKLLHAEEYDEIRIVSQRISGEFTDMTIYARIEISGEQHEVELPVSVAMYGDRLVANGRTDISHSELGLSPFTAGLGTLRVAEDMTFRYRIVAVKSR